MNDIRDERGIPVSQGVPVAVRIAAAIGVFVIFIMGGITIKAADYGHKWPASQTLTLELK